MYILSEVQTIHLSTAMWVVQGLIGLVITLAGYAINQKAESIKREQQLVTASLDRRIKDCERDVKCVEDELKALNSTVVTKSDIADLKDYIREMINNHIS